MPTITVTLDGSSASVPITVSGGLTPVTPWRTGLATMAIGSVPTRPPFSNLKGSAQSMVVTPSPWTPVENTLRFTVSDAELTNPTPPGRTPPSSSHNPAAALCGPQGQFKEGTEAWIRWRFQLPTGLFPQIVPDTPATGAFLLLGELHGGVFVGGVETWPTANPGFSGYPFGSPATSLACDNLKGQEMLTMARGYPHFDRIWSTPLPRDRMTEVAFHIVFSANPAIGLREVFLNGTQQTFIDGRKSWTGDNTLHQVPSTAAFPPALWGLTEALTAYEMLYFTKGLYAPSAASPAGMFHGDMLVGNSLIAVT